MRCIGIPQEDEEAQEADEEHYYYFIPVLRIHLNTDLDSCSTLLLRYTGEIKFALLIKSRGVEGARDDKGGVGDGI